MESLAIDILAALKSLESDTWGVKAKPASSLVGTLSIASDKTSAWWEGLPTEGAASFDYLFKRLVKDKEPLFLLGESPQRGLSISLAVMRGSLKHIWATRLKPERVFWTRGDFFEHIQQSRERGKINAGMLAQNGFFYEGTSADFDSFIEHCREALDEMDLLPNFSLKADARQLRIFFDDPQLLPLAHKHIFFQCPWDRLATASLMRDTVRSAAEVQGPGDLLLFGLIDSRVESYPNCGDHRRQRYQAYESKYEVPKLQIVAVNLGYKPLTEDKDLIRRCLHFGYRHYSETPITIHEKLVRNDELIIYLFIKLSPPKKT
ncbi:hypothetical protein DFH06DRAFT_1204801 [Mycena polygramma]|nr:hypothetical protein DFH06DRAFT_1204801 [Mycena polygramma]